MKRAVFLMVFVGCGVDSQFQMIEAEVCLDKRGGGRFCIETYEASRADASSVDPGADDETAPVSLVDRVPWTELTWNEASTACTKKGKRLCTRNEWIDACDGAVGEAEGSQYAYGDDLDAALCNTSGGILAARTFPECRSAFGTFDQSGNVWEWTGVSSDLAAARGGSFRSTIAHGCLSGDQSPILDVGGRSAEVGFRCCRDL